MVQEYTKNKCRLANIDSKSGISASLVCADAIIKSEWNTHKISKKYNNLNLLEANDFWYGKDKDHEGRFYRIYECWFDYAADLSDYFVFSGQYSNLLLSKNLDQQIDLLSIINDQPSIYRSKIEELIADLGLWEFDLS